MNSLKVPYYRLYIDESGDHTYKDLTYVSHRYLGLLGCIFERANDYQKAADELKKLKEKFWPKPDPDRPVIFHREDMVNFRGYFSRFRDEVVRKEFDDSLIGYIKRQKFIIAVQINVVVGMLKVTSSLRGGRSPTKQSQKRRLLRPFGARNDDFGKSNLQKVSRR